jgi:hypothetical protein
MPSIGEEFTPTSSEFYVQLNRRRKLSATGRLADTTHVVLCTMSCSPNENCQVQSRGWIRRAYLERI